MKTNGYNLDFPITAVSISSFDYIFDGHKRTSCAIKKDIDLIPVVYKNENDCFSEGLTYKDDIMSSIKQTLFYDWEDFNSFNYLIYPKL